MNYQITLEDKRNLIEYIADPFGCELEPTKDWLKRKPVYRKPDVCNDPEVPLIEPIKGFVPGAWNKKKAHFDFIELFERIQHERKEKNKIIAYYKKQGVIFQDKEDLARLMKLANGEIMNENEEEFYLKQVKKKRMLLEKTNQLNEQVKMKLLNSIQKKENTLDSVKTSLKRRITMKKRETDKQVVPPSSGSQKLQNDLPPSGQQSAKTSMVDMSLPKSEERRLKQPNFKHYRRPTFVNSSDKKPEISLNSPPKFTKRRGINPGMMARHQTPRKKKEKPKK